MIRLLDRMEDLGPGRMVAAAGGLVILLVLAGWSLGALRGSALGGQVAAAAAALLLCLVTLLYAFGPGTSSDSE